MDKVIVLAIALIILSSNKAYCEPFLEGTASWYGGKETLNEYTASGRRFNAHEYGCAIYDIPFNARLRVCNVANGKCVDVTVWDRGPALRLSRVVDLYRAAFEKIAPLSRGLIKVTVEVLLWVSPSAGIIPWPV